MTKERARQKALKYLEWAEIAERKSKELYASFQGQYGSFDWTEPIKIGHHSERRHRKVFERRDNVMRKTIELDQKAKRFREKADNLIAFSERNKGDAERAREEKRAQNDNVVKVGMLIDTVIFGVREVVKINKKTYTVRGQSGGNFTVDKSFVRF